MQGGMINTSYKDLIVWQKAIDLVVEVYKLTAIYPPEEKYGLVSQSRRCTVSIPSNIAEGKRRGTKAQFIHFLTISFGSGAELETQIIIAKKLEYAELKDYIKVDLLLDEVMRMLNTLINKSVGWYDVGK